MKKHLLNFLIILFFHTSVLTQPASIQLKSQDVVKSKSKEVIRLKSNEFKFQRLKPIAFYQFSYNDFKIKSSDIIKLKNGKTIKAEKFLQEVNEIEKKLNEWGYSLRDERNEVIIAELNFPYDLVEQQSKLLKISDEKILNEDIKITPCGVISDSELKSAIKSGTPQEPWPIKHQKNWYMTFGDENFGIDINSNFNLSAEEKSNLLNASAVSNIEVNIKIFNESIPAINLEDRIFNKPFQDKLTMYILNNRVINDNFNTSADKNYYKNFYWATDVDFSLGPFDVSGTFNINGGVGIIKKFNSNNLKLEDKLSPYVNLDFYGKLNVGFEIIEAGIDGKIKFINDTLSLMRELELKQPDIGGGYFCYSTIANNKMLEALKGKIYAYLEVDYLIGSKKFILVFYKNENGFSFNNNIFSLNVNQPARRDRELYLEILRINGITNYTARNEKNDVIPLSFEVCVDAGGQSFNENISDWNNDGIIDTPLKFKIPLLSSLTLPIKIAIKEKYKIGKLNFESWLDLIKGEIRDIELCYNPISRKLFGAIEGKEEQEIILTGDANYFGERNHSIKFKLIPHMQFKSAPARAK